ncbi:fermitin-like protein 2 [Dermatophagoides farinae]|uniref:Fermitin-like protein 2 n=1 Tax=Dermatophagoides farinae TaxID=6954 RepID=A0A9D4NZC2_DERFA|nr:fermitin-like protein 2 [Dermatophagoides farinae]
MENDRTWPLKIRVYYGNIEHKNDDDDVLIRVRGDYSIGNLMALIGQQIGAQHDWSDYALWWPTKKRWLKNCRMTMDQVDVCANTILEFRQMHQTLRIQFPDLNIQELKIDFSVNVLQAVAKLCQIINISHPEEWSFARPLTNHELKRNDHHNHHNRYLQASPLQRFPSTTTTLSRYKTTTTNNNNNNNNIYSNTMMMMNHSSNGSLLSQKSSTTISSNGSSSMNDSNHSLTKSFSITINNNSNNSRDTVPLLLPHPKSSIQKARLNSAWLNASISLFEQDVCENDLLLLKVKYFTFYDLKSSELTRINYLYENLKWNILQEQISCTEDEMYTLAGIMLQVSYCSGENGRGKQIDNRLLSTPPPPSMHNNNSNGHHHHHHNHHHQSKMNGNGYHNHNNNNNNNNNGNGLNGSISSSTSTSNDIDEVDCALETLEKELQTFSIVEKSNSGGGGGGIVTRMVGSKIQIPILEDKLKISCQKMKNSTSTLARIKSTISGNDRTYYTIFRDTTLYAYRPQDFDHDSMNPTKEPEIVLNMNICEVNPDVLASQQRYCFQIIDSSKSRCYYYVKCQSELQYAKWFAACKQASQGHTMAHSSYDEQVHNTLKLLQIQSKFSKTKNVNKQELKSLDVDPSQFIAPRFLKRKSKEQILARIKLAHEISNTNTLIEAQMNFIKTCQTLKDYGITMFVVRFHKSKKEDLLGAMPDKLVLIDVNNGTLRKTWRYKTMINWNINWEVKRMSINFRDETLEFECISADCKVIHEFIGGYIYMSMRGNQIDSFDEEQFLKLTGGWNEDDLVNGDDDEDEHIAMCRREAWANLHPGLMVK